MLHDVDNTSDHDALYVHLTLDVAKVDFRKHISWPKTAWDKAND